MKYFYIQLIIHDYFSIQETVCMEITEQVYKHFKF